MRTVGGIRVALVASETSSFAITRGRLRPRLPDICRARRLTEGTAAAFTRLVSPTYYSVLFASFAFVLGASIGSFLNVCIYRMPRDLSVNKPRRSFCPKCEYAIPFWHNLPLFSWLFLRGKCANCRAPISFRYFGVELLTALLFLGVWLHVWPSAWVLALPYWILVSLLVVATFIDFEFFIIPDEITWGGVVAGVLLSLAVPTMMGVTSPLVAGAWSLAGAATGYFLLWGVVELGKKLFGRKRIVCDPPEDFVWTRKGQDADFQVGAEMQLWSEFFSRDSDRLLMQCKSAAVAGETFENALLEFHYDRLEIGGRTWALDQLETITGTVSEIVVPREAMGFGDVKFIAAIGAFLGLEGGAFYGDGCLLRGRGDRPGYYCRPPP